MQTKQIDNKNFKTANLNLKILKKKNSKKKKKTLFWNSEN